MRRFSVAPIRGFVPAETRPYHCAQIYPAAFSARQCERIIADAEGLAANDAFVGDGLGDPEHDDAIRRSRVSWLPAEDPFVWVYDKLAGLVRRANRHYDFDLIGFTEDLQFTEYDSPGAFFTWHQDGLDGDLAARKLSLVVQLSDPVDYEGGDLEFFALDGDGAELDVERRAALRRRGSVIVFPAFEYHRVTAVVSGTRRSLVCWVGGPPFR